MRAAQYVRMSTEHQQFSIENQIAVIAEYAAAHDFEVVRTYSDEARSGIDLAHRPGLKRLLDDITSGTPDFRAVLVYDVSRWGRFQDADESACYEFLCRRAGVNVLYCAEPFANDLSLAASLFKTLKRAMAGEYLRELSAKVYAGHCRLVRKGFKAGGSAGYGLRRLLLSPDGSPKTILEDGERKSLITERVTFTLGPANEVRTVRKIYSLFLDEDLDFTAIARWLNNKKVPYGKGNWHLQIVRAILTHPRYTGSIVYGRRTERLRSKPKRNPRDAWIVRPNSFPAIVSQPRFDAVQSRLKERICERSNERLLQDLRCFIEKHGRATYQMLATDPAMPDGLTYDSRFGSFSRAKALATTEPDGGFSLPERRSRMKIDAQDRFAEIMGGLRIESKRVRGVFRSRLHPPMLLDVARCRTLKGGQLRWEIRYPLCAIDNLHCIVLRLTTDNNLPLDYLLFRRLPPGNQRYRLSEQTIHEMASIHGTLDEAVGFLLQNGASVRR